MSGDTTHTAAVDLRVWWLSATYDLADAHGDARQMRPPAEIHTSGFPVRFPLRGLLTPPPPLALFQPASHCLCDVLLFDPSLTFPAFHLELLTGRCIKAKPRVWHTVFTNTHSNTGTVGGKMAYVVHNSSISHSFFTSMTESL